MEKSENRELFSAQIFHILLTTSVIAFSLLIYYVMPYVTPHLDIKVLPLEDPSLFLIKIILGIVGIFTLAAGYFSPRSALIWGKQNLSSPFSKTFQRHLFRITLFCAIGVYGFILGILGAELIITLPFFLVPFIALLLTFPTAHRWEQMTEQINNSQGTTIN